MTNTDAMAPGGRGLLSGSELPSLNHSASIYSIGYTAKQLLLNSPPPSPRRASGVLLGFCIFNREDTNEADMGCACSSTGSDLRSLGHEAPQLV